MIRKLRIKFILVNMLIVMVMLGVIFAMVLHFTQNSMQMQSVQMMQAAAEDRGHRPWPRPGGACLVIVLDEEGQIEELRGEEEYDYSRQELEQMVLLAKDHGERVGLLKQYDLRYCFAHSPDGEELVLSDISFEREMLLNLVRDCLIVGAISLLLFFAISLLLSKWAIRPVEKAWIQQRQFVADASHELKTPLTVILTNAELLQRPQYGEEQKGTFTRNILTVSHQMKGLVEKLLELARVDAGAVKLSKVPLDLTGIISEAMLSFEVMFFEKGLSVTSDLAENVQVLGSEDHLRQMVEILLDNALKYSLPGETTVSLTGHGHHAVLRVSNPGQALSEEELRNIFKRFYRADSARSMNGSYGLGLPIAQGIVQEHGGKIKAQSANGMTTFTVTIPLIK